MRHDKRMELGRFIRYASETTSASERWVVQMESSTAELAGAKVLFMTSNGPKNNFGHVEKKRITALAICEYSGSPGDIYVFACDRHWQVVGDLL